MPVDCCSNWPSCRATTQWLAHAASNGQHRLHTVSLAHTLPDCMMCQRCHIATHPSAHGGGSVLAACVLALCTQHRQAVRGSQHGGMEACTCAVVLGSQRCRAVLISVQLCVCCCMTAVDTASVLACWGAPCLLASSWPVAITYVCVHMRQHNMFVLPSVTACMSNCMSCYTSWNTSWNLQLQMSVVKLPASHCCQVQVCTATPNSLHQHPAIMHKSSSKSKVRLPHARQ